MISSETAACLDSGECVCLTAGKWNHHYNLHMFHLADEELFLIVPVNPVVSSPAGREKLLTEILSFSRLVVYYCYVCISTTKVVNGIWHSRVMQTLFG